VNHHLFILSVVFFYSLHRLSPLELGSSPDVGSIFFSRYDPTPCLPFSHRPFVRGGPAGFTRALSFFLSDVKCDGSLSNFLTCSGLPLTGSLFPSLRLLPLLQVFILLRILLSFGFPFSPSQGSVLLRCSLFTPNFEDNAPSSRETNPAAQVLAVRTGFSPVFFALCFPRLMLQSCYISYVWACFTEDRRPFPFLHLRLGDGKIVVHIQFIPHHSTKRKVRAVSFDVNLSFSPSLGRVDRAPKWSPLHFGPQFF